MKQRANRRIGDCARCVNAFVVQQTIDDIDTTVMWSKANCVIGVNALVLQETFDNCEIAVLSSPTNRKIVTS